MLTPEYKRDVNKNYLILRTQDDLDTQSYQVRMLMTGTVPGLLSCRLQNMNSRTDACYDITSRQQLSSLYEGRKLSYSDLQLVFGGFVKVMESAAEYLLNPDMFILKPDFMYADAGQKELFFCYLPGYDESIRTQFQELTEYLLPRLDHEDQRAVMLGYGVYRRAMDDTFHLEQIKEELYRRQTEPEPNIHRQPEFSADLSRKMEAVSPPADRRRALFTGKADIPVRPSPDPISDGPLPVYERSLSPASSRSSPVISAGKRILQPVLVVLLAAAMAGLAAAKYFGYLPQIPILLILGGGAGLLALVVCLSLIMTKNRKLTEPEMLDELLARRHEEENLQDSTHSTPDSRPVDTTPEWTGEDLAPAARQTETSETVVLTAASVVGPASLVSREPGELATIYLSEELTVIGKLKGAADAVIDLPTVSRVHAKIRRRNDEYFLTDLNSRNGTSVNGKILQAEEDCLLQNQDEVDFAQARFVFLK
ncbi:MAG: FHA domain-containing protein [Blautia sp.]|nr:FHA domain-containing protein [Blautia sp.]